MFSDGNNASMYDHKSVKWIQTLSFGILGGRRYARGVWAMLTREDFWTCNFCVMKRNGTMFGTFFASVPRFREVIRFEALDLCR